MEFKKLVGVILSAIMLLSNTNLSFAAPRVNAKDTAVDRGVAKARANDGLLSAAALETASKGYTDVAYPVDGGDIYFDESTGTITFCDPTVTSANIPSEINGIKVTSIDDRAFSQCSVLSSVTIPDSVTSIANGAFYGCSKLSGIALPKGITSIENAMFAYCTGLSSVTIPEGVTSIGALRLRTVVI